LPTIRLDQMSEAGAQYRIGLRRTSYRERVEMHSGG
jgi:hypothetical protein